MLQAHKQNVFIKKSATIDFLQECIPFTWGFSQNLTAVFGYNGRIFNIYASHTLNAHRWLHNNDHSRFDRPSASPPTLPTNYKLFVFARLPRSYDLTGLLRGQWLIMIHDRREVPASMS